MATREQAGLPLYPELRWVTLTAMRGLPMPASNADIDEAVADALGLTEHQRTLINVDGRRTELAYRVAWCRTVLRSAGAIENTSRARWQTTEAGSAMSRAEMERRIAITKGITPKADGETGEIDIGAVADECATEPESWQETLIALLGRLSPVAFERLTAHLLRVAGIAELKVRQSGDGSIDGVGVYRTLLISFPVYFQCNRYQGSVTLSQVREFRSAMAGRGSHGLLITTGTVSQEAEKEASRAGAATVHLVNGDDLCDLLREYGLGIKVTQRVVEDVEIQQPFFEQFEETAQ